MTSAEPTETESVPTQSVHIPMNMDAETATYVAMLEGTIAALVISDCKNRTLLELLTGDGWEAARVDFNGKALISLAISALVKQTGMDRVRAQVLVSKRWQERNHPADYIVPQAVSPDSYVNQDASSQVNLVQPDVNMSDRVREWRARQLAAAENVDPEPTKNRPKESGSDSKSENESATIPTTEPTPKSGTDVPEK